MATITGEYTSSTALRVKATGLTSGTRYRLFVESFTSGSSDGRWYCLFANNMDSSGTIDWRSWSGLTYNGRRSVRLYYGTSGSYDAGYYYKTLPSNPYITGSVPAYTPPSNWYGLTITSGNGISSFRGYKESAGSSTDTSYATYSNTTTVKNDRFYISSIEPDSGYTYPITAYSSTTGTSWTVKTNSSTWSDHYVSFSTTAGSYRGVSLSATKLTYYYYKKTYYANATDAYYNNDPSDTGYHRVQTNPASITINLEAAYKPIRPNYIFKGYYVFVDSVQVGSTDESTTTYTVTFSSTGSASSPIRVNLYARWEAVPQYTYKITFNPNRGTGAPSPVSYGPTTSTSCQLHIPSEIPTKDGYQFMGWGLSSSSISPAAQPNTGYWLYSSDPQIVMYAVWEPLYYGRVQYHLEGGSMMGSILDIYNGPTRSRVGQGTYQDTILPVVPTKSGYTFNKWGNTASILAADKWDPGDSITINCNSTDSSSPTNKHVYAIWDSGIPTYYGRLRFNGNEGTPVTQYSATVSGQPPIASIPSCYVRITISATNPTRTGYTFKGWSYNGTLYNNGDSFDVLCNSTNQASPNITDLYANWEKNQYTINFNPNGGTPTPTPKRDYYNTTFSLTPYSNGVRRTGYTLLGWDESPNPLMTPTYRTYDNYTIKGNATLYAIWSSEDIQEFYYYSGAQEDDAKFSRENYVDNAVTATVWNKLISKVETLYELEKGTKPHITRQLEGRDVGARSFNDVRSYITELDGHGTMVLPKSEGDWVRTYDYNRVETGTNRNSLKAALNNAIRYYNEHY